MPRLYLPEPFSPRDALRVSDNQAHYLTRVMRLREGDEVSVFNGEDGEWRATIEAIDKKNVMLSLIAQTHPQQASPNVWLVFVPIKAKTELVVEKATELGASRIITVFSERSVVLRTHREKLTAHAIEAAEQCERLDVPMIEECANLSTLLAGWPKDRALYYGDETGGGAPILSYDFRPPCAVLIGPEGGFSQTEHALLRAQAFVKSFSLGPRILKADTAASAALACVMNALPSI